MDMSKKSRFLTRALERGSLERSPKHGCRHRPWSLRCQGEGMSCWPARLEGQAGHLEARGIGGRGVWSSTGLLCWARSYLRNAGFLPSSGHSLQISPPWINILTKTKFHDLVVCDNDFHVLIPLRDSCVTLHFIFAFQKI